jgi:hypothetical protein
MSRYTTLDPTLISSASDKRKAPSLVAPSAAKKKRTSKKRLIQVRNLPFQNIKTFFILIIFILCNFRPELSNHWSLQNLPMPHLLVNFSPSHFLVTFSSLALILYLLVAAETLVRQTVGSSSPQHVSNLTSPRIQPSSLQAEASASPRIPPASPQPEASTLPRTLQAYPQLDIQEPLLEPEKLPSPTQEARNYVSMNTHLSIFPFNKSPLIRQEKLFQEETASSPIYSFAVDDLIAEKGMKHLPVRLYQRKIRKS